MVVVPPAAAFGTSAFRRRHSRSHKSHLPPCHLGNWRAAHQRSLNERGGKGLGLGGSLATQLRVQNFALCKIQAETKQQNNCSIQEL